MSKNWKDETALATEGGYGSGFWTWHLDVDLEDLKAGKGEDAISVYSQHDTAGMSFSEYHGITRSYKLPDGVKTRAVQELIDIIVERAAELTEGFEAVWNGSNHVARWNEDEAYEDEGGNFAEDFWNTLAESICEMDCLMPYDLSDSQNIPFVMENLQAHDQYSQVALLEGSALEEKIEEMLNELYDDGESYEYIHTGYGFAAARIAQNIEEAREEDED